MNDIYELTIPVFVKFLGGLRAVLLKAQASAAGGGITQEELLTDRLAPDMFPLIKQVQIACDHAKGAAARLSGNEPPKFDDIETTIHELLVRIDKTLAYIKTIPPESLRDAAQRKIALPYFPGKYLTGFDYTREYAIPNFFFHVVTAYDIVRKNGVPIGKADFINGLSLISE